MPESDQFKDVFVADISKLKHESSSHDGDIKKLSDGQKNSDRFMIGIIVAFFIAFVGLSFALGAIMVDSFRSKEASYNDLSNKISEQNYEIQKMILTNNETSNSKDLINCFKNKNYWDYKTCFK